MTKKKQKFLDDFQVWTAKEARQMVLDEAAVRVHQFKKQVMSSIRHAISNNQFEASVRIGCMHDVPAVIDWLQTLHYQTKVVKGAQFEKPTLEIRW